MLLGVDVGGTFTDAALLTPSGLVTAKAPSTPDDQSEGVLEAVQAALDAAGASASDIERFVHGMTVGTNALLEGKMARTALLATEGFIDLEELRRQARPQLYRLCAGHPPPIVPPGRRVPVPERAGPDGALRDLDEPLLRERLNELDPEVESGALRAVGGPLLRGGLHEPDPEVDSAAICLLWSFRHPRPERRAAEIAEERLPEVHVSTSSDTAAVFREYERLATTVVDAALSPVLRRYLERLAKRAGDEGVPPVEGMLSGGGGADADAA